MIVLTTVETVIGALLVGAALGCALGFVCGIAYERS